MPGIEEDEVCAGDRGGIDQGKISRSGIDKRATSTTFAAKVKAEYREKLSEYDLLGGDTFLRRNLLSKMLGGLCIGISRCLRVRASSPPGLEGSAIGIFIQVQMDGVSLRREKMRRTDCSKPPRR
jgi:hypothetical protein